MNPIALRKANIVYNFGLSECSRVKKKQVCFQRTIKIIFFALCSYFLTVKMHSEKKKFSKKVSYLPILFFSGYNPPIFYLAIVKVKLDKKALEKKTRRI